MKSLRRFLRTNAEDITNISEQACKVLCSTPFVGMTFAFIRPIVAAIGDDSAVGNGIADTIERLNNLMSSVLVVENINQDQVSSFLTRLLMHTLQCSTRLRPSTT
mmetsp:Transcript_24326/g.23380  ORF Transcript_24326/g.23380 Transcript_24326/m.23380 type:complete len:105 (+) Transcript_24326:71-385(+)